jgi:hypothetical protein
LGLRCDFVGLFFLKIQSHGFSLDAGTVCEEEQEMIELWPAISWSLVLLVEQGNVMKKQPKQKRDGSAGRISKYL